MRITQTRVKELIYVPYDPLLHVRMLKALRNDSMATLP